MPRGGVLQWRSENGHRPRPRPNGGTFCAALIKAGAPHFDVLSYHEHSVQSGASALAGASAIAAAYVRVQLDHRTQFGASLDPNLTKASLKAIVSALNLLSRMSKGAPPNCQLLSAICYLCSRPKRKRARPRWGRRILSFCR